MNTADIYFEVYDNNTNSAKRGGRSAACITARSLVAMKRYKGPERFKGTHVL